MDQDIKQTPKVEFRNITKRFPGVVALSDVSLSVMRGSCHGLVGENGAGKSTLGKALAGIHPLDEGQILIDGKPVRITNSTSALKNGIGMVHQELAFCENMSVAENLCLGQTPAVGPFTSQSRMIRMAQERLAAIGAKIDVNQRLGLLPISQQQMVQIASAVGRGASVLVFDEPTSSLSQVESERLFELIERLQADGVTCIYVSHRLEEIFRLCDTVSVLRDGRHVGTKPVDGLDEAELIQMMIGRPFEAYFPSHLSANLGNQLLRVEHLSSPGKFKDISFTLHAGEILGFAGLVGAGRTELAEAIFGLDPMATGSIYVEGKPAAVIGDPQAAMALGLGLVPEDRKRHGLVLSMNARENISLPILKRLSRLGWVRRREEDAITKEYFWAMRVRASSINAVAASLSGGNQQKLVIARWLAARCRILLVDEPTRGVDVGAKAEIHNLIDRLASQGSAVLMVSSELPEILNLSTRIIVLRNGRIVGELNRDEYSQEAVGRLMAGIGPQG